MMAITLALFAAGILMGVGGALFWAWGVRAGQFRDLEKTKHQLFWPEIASGDNDRIPAPTEEARPRPGI